MSKRINQRFENNSVNTYTTGTPRGNLPNFDVMVTSYSQSQHRPTTLSLDFEQKGKKYNFDFDGRNARTLYEVLTRHFEQVD